MVPYHGTFTVNSLAHIFGKRRFATDDNSRNNFFVALITLGEGWHNNHHYYPSSERQGFYWWELDVSHYTLRALSWLGIVWDLRTPPPDLTRLRISSPRESLERSGGKASMRKQAVIADAYGERRREVQAKKQDQINWARPKPQPQETAGM